MTTMTRRAAIVAVCVLALSMTACSNNSGGKIVGKWKVTNLSDVADTKAMDAFSAALCYEFGADNTFKVSYIATRPEMEKLVENINKDKKITAMSGTYSLGMGDTVNFTGGIYAGKEKATTQFKRTGDKAQMKDPDGTTLDLELVK